MQTDDGTGKEFSGSSEQSWSAASRSGQDDGESSEAAGFVRGLVRTCQIMIRRVAVGQVPVRRVAKISDVTSNAIDLASNMSEATESNGSSDSSSSSRYLRRFGDALPRKMLIIATKFVGTLVKNTILGAAVFETYERSIDYIADEDGEPHRSVSDHKTSGEDRSSRTTHSSKAEIPDSYTVVSVPGHFVAGAAAGAVHSALSIAMDCAASRSLGELRSFVPTTLHHSIAHSVLFGGYEWTKRSLARVCDGVFISSPRYRYASIFGDDVTKTSDEQATVYGYSVMVTAFAGGTAGVMQHVCSHYTGMWLCVETTQLSYYQLDRKDAGAKGTKEASALRPWRSTGELRSCLAQTRRMFLPAPALRPTLLTFPTFAVAFLAFEYGKDVSTALVEYGAD